MCAIGWRALVTIAGLVASSCSNPVTAPSRPAPRVAPGVHPNDAGHAIIFQRVDAVLQSGRCVAAPH